jgi:hypothetical protein
MHVTNLRKKDKTKMTPAAQRPRWVLLPEMHAKRNSAEQRQLHHVTACAGIC